MRTRWYRLPAAAVAAGLPALLAGMLVAPSPLAVVGPGDDTVRTQLADAPPVPATGDTAGDGLDGAHPVTVPGTGVLEPRLDGSARDDRNRGVPVRVSGTALPAHVLLAYRNATASLSRSDPGCHLSWSLVAGIGKVESGHAFGGAVDRQGRTLTPILGPVLDGAGDFAAIPDSDGGRWDGDTTWDRAVGPMQFIPSSWATWGRDGDGNGTTDPSDIDDASLATASYLCAGNRDLADQKDRRSAVFSYNHSWDYVDLVLAWADAYASGSSVTGTLAGQGSPQSDGGDLGGTTHALGPPIGATPKPGTPAPAATPEAPVEPPASAAPPVEPAPAPTSQAQAPGPTSAAPTVRPTPTPTPTPHPSATVEPSSCPTPPPTPTPTGTATQDPTGTATPTPAPDPTQTPDPTATPSPIGSPTDCPTPDAQL